MRPSPQPACPRALFRGEIMDNRPRRPRRVPLRKAQGIPGIIPADGGTPPPPPIGDWRGTYGADGYWIAADTSGTNPNLPGYATVNLTGMGAAAWTTDTTEPRALQNAAGSGRIAGAWFTN